MQFIVKQPQGVRMGLVRPKAALEVLGYEKRLSRGGFIVPDRCGNGDLELAGFGGSSLFSL